MQDAVPEGQGAMAAILGMNDVELAEICRQVAQNEIVAPVNFNALGQTVIAGNKQAVERAATLAKEKGAKKVVPLPVSVPSHCALMLPAARILSNALEKVAIKTPQIPVIHNVDVKTHSHPDDIRNALVQQLSQPVQWVQTIQRFANEKVQTIVECGPGKVLTGLIKRIEPEILGLAIESKAGFEEALEKL
jgi:[acyl-carrier-protein] S-malonyltransferase